MPRLPAEYGRRASRNSSAMGKWGFLPPLASKAAEVIARAATNSRVEQRLSVRQARRSAAGSVVRFPGRAVGHQSVHRAGLQLSRQFGWPPVAAAVCQSVRRARRSREEVGFWPTPQGGGRVVLPQLRGLRLASSGPGNYELAAWHASRHNPSVERTSSGMPPKPAVWLFQHLHTPGLGATPPGSAHLER
jgi:hypothetical protein